MIAVESAALPAALRPEQTREKGDLHAGRSQVKQAGSITRQRVPPRRSAPFGPGLCGRNLHAAIWQAPKPTRVAVSPRILCVGRSSPTARVRVRRGAPLRGPGRRAQNVACGARSATRRARRVSRDDRRAARPKRGSVAGRDALDAVDGPSRVTFPHARGRASRAARPMRRAACPSHGARAGASPPAPDRAHRAGRGELRPGHDGDVRDRSARRLVITGLEVCSVVTSRRALPRRRWHSWPGRGTCEEEKNPRHQIKRRGKRWKCHWSQCDIQG